MPRATEVIDKREGKKITYLDLNKDFTLLDENYMLLNIDGHLIDSVAEKYGFRTGSFKKYSDTLAVILMIKHEGDWSKMRKELRKVTSTWDRYSLYFHLTPEETKKLGEEINVKFPSDLYDYFADESVETRIKQDHFNRIREECFLLTLDSTVYRLPSNVILLTYAFNIGANDRHRGSHEH